MYYRRIVKNNVRSAFIEKGGKPIRQTPLYFILGESHIKNHIIYKEWHKYTEFIEISIDEINTDTVSFTYGDSFIENYPEHRDQTKYHETVHTYKGNFRNIGKSRMAQDFVKR